MDGRFAIALQSHQSKASGELDFPSGAQIFVLEELPGGWLRGKYEGQSGLFPKRYVMEDTRKASVIPAISPALNKKEEDKKRPRTPRSKRDEDLTGMSKVTPRKRSDKGLESKVEEVQREIGEWLKDNVQGGKRFTISIKKTREGDLKCTFFVKHSKDSDRESQRSKEKERERERERERQQKEEKEREEKDRDRDKDEKMRDDKEREAARVREMLREWGIREKERLRDMERLGPRKREAKHDPPEPAELKAPEKGSPRAAVDLSILQAHPSQLSPRDKALSPREFNTTRKVSLSDKKPDLMPEPSTVDKSRFNNIRRSGSLGGDSPLPFGAAHDSLDGSSIKRKDGRMKRTNSIGSISYGVKKEDTPLIVAKSSETGDAPTSKGLKRTNSSPFLRNKLEVEKKDIPKPKAEVNNNHHHLQHQLVSKQQQTTPDAAATNKQPTGLTGMAVIDEPEVREPFFRFFFFFFHFNFF